MPPSPPPRTRTNDPEFRAPSSDAELLDLCTGEGIGIGLAVGGVDDMTWGPLCPEEADMNMDFLMGRLSVGSCSLPKSLHAATTMASKASLEVDREDPPADELGILAAMTMALPGRGRGSAKEGRLRRFISQK